jgi:hypothetical protein
MYRLQDLGPQSSLPLGLIVYLVSFLSASGGETLAEQQH